MKLLRWLLLVALLGLAALGVLYLNTETLFGRWAIWQSPGYDDHTRYPSVAVANDQANAASLPPALNSISAMPSIQGRAFEQYLSENDTTAFIVLRDGAVVYEKYFNGKQRSDVATSFSMAKSVLSTLVGIAIEQKHIGGVKDPVTKYVPELSGKGFDRVTIEHLLTMSSGVRRDDPRLFDVSLWWSDEIQAFYSPDLQSVLLGLTLSDAPGQKFRYNDYNAQLVGLILQRATKVSVPTYLERNLWRPLGMEYPATWSVDSTRTRFAKMESGLNARPVDYAKLGQLFLNGGTWRGTQIVPADWVRQSTTQQAPDLLGPMVAKHVDADASIRQAVASMRYYYLWWGVEREGHRAYYANGHLGQFIYVVPEARLVIVRSGRSWGKGMGDQNWLKMFHDLTLSLQEK